MKAPGYHTQRLCKNCIHAEVKMSPGGRVGYYCNKYQSWCSKSKVCDDHRWENDHQVTIPDDHPPLLPESVVNELRDYAEEMARERLLSVIFRG